MNISLQVPQGEVFTSDARFRVLAAGRRFGKTFLAGIELCRAAWFPRSKVWYVAPTYIQAKRIAWVSLKQLTRPYWASRPNETDLRIELISGGTIALRGADNYDSLRGEGLDFVVLDEYASMAREAWTEVLRPSLADRCGGALFIGTPKGLNHFYDLFQSARNQDGWAAFQYTTQEGGNVSAQELASAAHELDERTFRQEFQASFENLGHGRVYYAFDRSANVAPLRCQSQIAICWALDFNVNPMCSVIVQIEDHTTQRDRMDGLKVVVVNVIDEIILADSNTLQACEAFAARLDQISPGAAEVRIYGDASGSRRSTAGASDYQIIREFFRTRSGLRVTHHVPNANPAVRDRVNAVNGMLCNSQGKRRLLVDPHCKGLIRDFERVVWKADSYGNLGTDLDKSNPELTHVSDALGYLLEHEFGHRTAGGFRSGSLL
jgi:hypothetical protein